MFSVCSAPIRHAAVLVALSALPSVAPAVFAQSFTHQRPVNDLSPASLAKLDTIGSLATLPATDWRFHAGDLPHGESTTLDDSSWTLVHPGAAGPNEAVWYRHELVIPRTLHGYDISGSAITFQFRADANGPVPEIIYLNGRRVALGDDLEPITLFESAKPGDKVLIAVKLLHTVDAKHFRTATLRIEPNPEASSNHRPYPEDIRTQIITAANILPHLTPSRKDLLPKVQEALDAINMNALTAGNQAAFDASLRKSQVILDTLHDPISTAKIDLTGNAHIDAAWLWPRSETIDVVKRTFTTALQLMNEYPDYTYSQSAAQYNEWMADKYPALNDQIKQRVKEGRWELVGGMWVEPDLNLPDGETTVRQLLLGNRYFQKEYGVTARIGWNPDSFGYNWQLPQIYKRAGLDYFVTQKMHWNDTNQLPFRLFWWESPDGSKVLTYFPTDYVHTNVDPTRISADFAQSAERNPGTSEMMDLYGIGDHGGGPTRAMLDQGDHWIAAGKKDAVPTMRYHTAQQYFSSVETHLNPESPTYDYTSIAQGYHLADAPAGEMSVPTWKSELYFEYHRGVFTTQAGHKRYMRTSEVATLDAEKLASLAWLSGQPYPNDQLTDAWKKITFNGFHDLAAGSGIAVIYRDAAKDFTEVFHTDSEISQNSLHTLAAQVDTQARGDAPLLVFNPLAWPRSETVQLTVQLPENSDSVRLLDTHNKPVLTQVLSTDAATHTFTVLAHVQDIPALGYTVLHAEHSGKSDSDFKLLKASETGDAITLENANLRVVIDKKNGCITSLMSLKSSTETIAQGACANQLQTFVDKPKEYDAWNIDPGTLDGTMTPISEVDSIALTDHGPLRATAHLSRSWQSSRFVQDISLDADADTVSVLNIIDWHETHVLLKAAFPLSATSAKATFEIPYGTIERPTTRNNSWEQAQFEVPALRWADLGDQQHGFSLLNDSKYGYDALGNTLRLTLLRSPTWPDPNADRGHQTFTYALYPHAGLWKSAQTEHRGYELNYPLSATQVESHTGSLPAEHSFASVENPNVILTAMKKAEDSNAIVFRMFEVNGQESQVKLHVPTGGTSATAINLMEKPDTAASASLAGDIVTATIHPYEILTLQVAYPAPVNHTAEAQ